VELESIVSMLSYLFWSIAAIGAWTCCMAIVWAFTRGATGTQGAQRPDPHKPTYVRPARDPLLAKPVTAEVIELRHVIRNVRWPINN
jgi:hypothetical protein